MPELPFYRNRICGMSSEWLTCLIVYQLFCISVVCADKHYTVHFFYSLYGLSYTGVYRLNSLDGCIFNTCMSTISGFAKLMITTSYFPERIASVSLSHTPFALISGFKS